MDNGPRGAASLAEPLRMVALAVLVGLPAGLLAVGLRGGTHALFEALSPWRAAALGVLVPAFGAATSVTIRRWLFRDPAGHGVPAVLEAVMRRGGVLSRRSVLGSSLAAMVNVASGGSAGLEGPIVTSSGALGSMIGGWRRVPERTRVLLVGCGVAGGIGAVFNAPLTGLVFALEVVLAEWSLGAVVPVAVSATVATQLARQALGSEGAFVSPGFGWVRPTDLAACAVLAALAGLCAVALVRALRALERIRSHLRRYPVVGQALVQAAVCGLGVGAIGLFLPGAIGEGYATVQRMLDGGAGGPGGGPGELGALLALLLAKLVATTLTLGSGATGGIFAPSLVLGSLLGAAFGRLLPLVLPAVEFAPPGAFALVAMAGLVAGTMHAPLTGIFLALETTGGWELSLPLILTAVVSATVSRLVERHSFYTRRLAEAGTLVRPGTDRGILTDMRVEEVVDPDSASVEAGRTLEDLVGLMQRTSRNHFAVVEPAGRRLLGMLDLTSLRPYLFDPELRRLTTVDTVMDSSGPRIEAGSTLYAALQDFERTGAWVLPVVREGVFLGTLSKSTLFDRYRQELIVQTGARG